MDYQCSRAVTHVFDDENYKVNLKKREVNKGVVAAIIVLLILILILIFLILRRVYLNRRLQKKINKLTGV